MLLLVPSLENALSTLVVEKPIAKFEPLCLKEHITARN